jgi:hypothetical protein
MRDTSKARVLDGVACLVLFGVAMLVLSLGSKSPAGFGVGYILNLLAACFALSYVRTWKKVYRNIAISLLLIILIGFHLALLLPRK